MEAETFCKSYRQGFPKGLFPDSKWHFMIPKNFFLLTFTCGEYMEGNPFSGVASILLLVLLGTGGCKADQEPSPVTLDTIRPLGEEVDHRETSRNSNQDTCTVCAGCHEEHFEVWVEGGHSQVSCTFCHGAAGDHILNDVIPRPPMKLRGGADLCLSCHGRSKIPKNEAIPQVGGLETHLQYVSEKHSVFIDVKKTQGRCVFCHDPHSLE